MNNLTNHEHSILLKLDNTIKINSSYQEVINILNSKYNSVVLLVESNSSEDYYETEVILHGIHSGNPADALSKEEVQSGEYVKCMMYHLISCICEKMGILDEIYI